MDDYDVIIIGTGAGGGTLAHHLAPSGKKILLLERADPGEVLVSRTVKDLVAGSGLYFIDRGTHALKGIPGNWQVLAATEAAPESA
jgi:choline dehydrogenase-like flavoprotein